MLYWTTGIIGGLIAIFATAWIFKRRNHGTHIPRQLIAFTRSIFTSSPARVLRALSPILLTLIVLAAVTAFSFSTNGTAPATATMPIRVMSTQDAQVSLDVSDGNAVTKMYLQAHQIGYHWTDGGMVEYRINSGSWTPIDNSVASCYEPEKQRGCVGGHYHTIRFTVPANNVTTGSNTVEFRWTSSEEVVNFGGSGSSDFVTAVRSATRILDIDFQDDSGNSYLDTDLVMDDPAKYGSPSGDASNGRDLWENAVLVASNRSGAPQIKASCADCHTSDGYDLQYFGYHNESIINRSVFHGLTRQQGKDIAAYIRSEHNFDPPARPWTPLYQPGPSIDESKPELWAAGAGLDAVLDEDQEMKSHLFPNGTNDWNRYSTDNTLNVRKIPIALQLPDWNNWLPDVHPFDALGESNFKDGSNDWAHPWQAYQDMISEAKDADYSQGGLQKSFKEITQHVLYGKYQFGAWADSYPEESIQQYSMHQWGIVKTWEIMHGVGHSHGNLQDLPPQIYSERTLSDSRLAVNGVQPQGEPLGWWGTNSNQVFNVGPHINGPTQHAGKGPFPSSGHNFYYSTAWYELQYVLNPGHRNPQAIKAQAPMDWKYHYGHIANDSKTTGLPQAYRYVKAQIKTMQQLDNADGVDGSGGWYERHLDVPRMFYDRNGEQSAALSGVSSSTLTDMKEGVMRAWIETTKQWDLSGTPSSTTWTRWTNSKKNELMPESYSPSASGDYGPGTDHADNIYKMMYDAEDDGVSAFTLNAVARWAEKAWPEGNWEQWMTSETTQSIALQEGWSLISSHVSPDPGEMTSIFSDVSSDLAIVQNSDGHSYDPEKQTNSLETWDATQGYRVYMSGKQTLSVDGYGPNSPTLTLQKGWNLVPYYPSSEMAVADAFASIEAKVKIVKDGAGNSYIPARNLDQIGSMKPGRAYKVYVSEETSFSYP